MHVLHRRRLTTLAFGLTLLSTACGEGVTDEPVEAAGDDTRDECVFCDEGKSDAFGIVRESYLAYGILNLANTASLEVLDDDVRLDARAARGIVAGRPFEFIEQLDTVPYVGQTAFTRMVTYASDNGFVPSCGDGGLQPLLEACDDGNTGDGDGCSSTCVVEEGGGQPAPGPDVHGIEQVSYLAYAILTLANTASLEVLDDDAALDGRAARGLVAGRPFANLEQVDEVSYMGASAFSKLTDYASDNGLVPSCGDGGLQPLLEACDDGNLTDGDGCSSTCSRGNGPPVIDLLADQPEVIKGSDIGLDVSFVKPSSYYFRQRRWIGRDWPADVVAIMERADGIVANEQSDDRVRFDELAILSKTPFFDSLLPHERDALDDAWDLFEISSAPAVTIDEGYGEVVDKIGVTTEIVRPGPFVVGPRETTSLTYSSTTRETVQRVQQLPGCDLDGDPATLEIADIDKVLTDYEQVFTRAELDALAALRPKFFEGLTDIATPGDFVIRYDFAPLQKITTKTIAEFDGFSFILRTKHHLAYVADSGGDYAKLYGDFRHYADLHYNGQDRGRCGYHTCDDPFTDREVRYVDLEDSMSSTRLRGIKVMEQWSNGERVYNRVVNFGRTYQEDDWTPQYLHEYVGARPMLADGTFLSLRFFKYQSGRDWFQLVPVVTAFNRTLEKLMPERHERLMNKLIPGRYAEFHGAVLDVHPSGALVAYYDGAECPLDAQNGYFQDYYCNGAEITVTATSTRATMSVRPRGGNREVAIFGEDADLWIDTSYNVIVR